MNIYKTIKQQIITALNNKFDTEQLNKISVERPRDKSHGDISTNIAMVLAKQPKTNPRELAQNIIDDITKAIGASSSNIAGAGFINFTMPLEFWHNNLANIIQKPHQYGDSDIGNNIKTNVEYVSANPTGPLHIGHARGAVFGDALANLLSKAGYKVDKEYYINDAGGQINILVQSTLFRYNQLLGKTTGDVPEGCYPGEYLIEIAQNLRKKHGDNLTEGDSELIRTYAVDAIMAEIKKDLSGAGINHDLFTSEYAVQQAGEIENAINKLKNADLVYQGVLEPPKGKKPDDWEEREQTLFKSTQFGDDVDRPLLKSDGSHTYFCGDLGYRIHKLRRGYDKIIDVYGADHGGYVKRITAGVTALSDGKTQLTCKLCQLVKLTDNGQPIKMSKRAGNFVTMRDVLNKIGKDVLRFIMLTRKNDAPLDFDLAKVQEQTKDNPVFYVQYASARAHSVLRNAAEAGYTIPDSYDILSTIKTPEELQLIKVLTQLPEIIEKAATSYEPHRIAFYLQDLANEFHSYWAMGVSKPELKFIIDGNQELTQARLLLVQAVANIIAEGLDVLGVKAVDRM